MKADTEKNIRKSGGTVVLKITDRILERALYIALKLNDYRPITESDSEADGTDRYITDDPGFDGDGLIILYICRTDRDEKNCDKKYSIVRPFDKETFLASVEKLFGRKGEVRKTAEKTGRSLRIPFRTDPKRGRVYYEGKYVSLTGRELKLFELLAANAGKAVSDADIIGAVWENITADNSNIAAVYVSYLRKKLKRVSDREFIIRVRGKGYMIKAETD